jgi:hypothetical protein
MPSIQDLGAHLFPALVGVGMATVCGACISQAMRMNRRLSASSAAVRIRMHALRTAMMLACIAVAFVPFVYLLVEMRISGTQVTAMLTGIVVGFALLVRERLLRPREFE